MGRDKHIKKMRQLVREVKAAHGAGSAVYEATADQILPDLEKVATKIKGRLAHLGKSLGVEVTPR